MSPYAPPFVVKASKSATGRQELITEEDRRTARRRRAQAAYDDAIATKPKEF